MKDNFVYGSWTKVDNPRLKYLINIVEIAGTLFTISLLLMFFLLNTLTTWTPVAPACNKDENAKAK